MLVGDPAACDLLVHGELEVQGRLIEASNATLLCSVEHDGATAECVYKPVRGERPLWDFPDGTLAGREYASYLVSEASGWGLIPPTVLREGPFGRGMVQLWVDVDDENGLVDVLAPEELPEGWVTVLRAQDQHGDPLILAHDDDKDLQRLAVLDIVLNNADRKGGHILRATDGRVVGIDHGVSLNSDAKLRTVLWGWMGQPLPEDALEMLERLRSRMRDSLAGELAEHITGQEVRAIDDRIEGLLETSVFPEPASDRPAIPWPPF